MTEIENKLATWFFSLIGYFNHYSFFTEKLWQQVPKFGGEDEANIKCAFMHLWFHNAFGYFTSPVGMTWFHETTEELYNDYIKQYQPVFKAYEKWIEKKEIKTKYIVYEDDFDTSEYVNMGKFDTKEEAQAYLDELYEEASLEDDYFISEL